MDVASVLSSSSGVTTSAGSAANSSQEFSTDLLKVYYGRLFPYEQMFNWLSYGNDPDPTKANPLIDKTFFSRREWSFTVEDDIYIRYQSFKNEQQFKDAIQKMQPHKIDIGAVFSASPKDKASINPANFHTVERELVFDIDMTDYDDIRTCCKGANICHKCWPYMTMALQVMDNGLREDFAFKHILWVYSGRRGIHCWVNDPIARSLTNEARSAIVSYFTVLTGTSENSDMKGSRNPFTSPLHPSLRRAYDILEPYFEKHIVDDDGQRLLSTKLSYMPIINSIKSPNDNDIIGVEIRRILYEKWEKDPDFTGAERWQHIKSLLSKPSASKSNAMSSNKKAKFDPRVYTKFEEWMYELVFKHCYPRLDANVSKMQNHLLKSPFCIHPKTGRVCIPINPSNADTFNPFAVPTVRSLCEEVDTYDRENANKIEVDQQPMDDRKKTSLQAYIETFNLCLYDGLKTTIKKEFSEKAKLLREQADENAAMLVDF